MATFADPPQELRRKTSHSSGSTDEKRSDPEAAVINAEAKEPLQQEPKPPTFYQRFRPFILAAIALVILGWWISSTVLKATRHRWIVQTIWAWFFILVIAFRFIPNRVVSKPVGSIWQASVSGPFFKLPHTVRLTIGWVCLLAIVFGSAFGFKLENGSTYADRAISVSGLVVFQLAFYAFSRNRSHIPWPTVIVGLFAQQAVALFVLKSRAGFDIFKWIADLASDFLAQALPGSAFFFDTETVATKHWFFVNTLGAIIFFIAFVQAMYYLGAVQWLLEKFAWFFYKIMNISGAEAVVAASSPWIGQGESACLVRPYVDLMTASELHLTMTSGFSCIAGSVMAAYIQMGVPAENIVTSSVMSIPASIAISKLRYPELDQPVTMGRVVIDRGEEKNAPKNVVHALSNGAIFGLVVAGQILANVLVIVSLVQAANGLLTWIGRGFGIHALTIQLVLKYIFYPVTFFMGVPRNEILRVSELLATKLIANEFVAYQMLKDITASDNPLSHRAYTIASYALCGFANLGSLGIQIGVLGAMAPSKKSTIAKIAFSAMICGFLSTMQTAGIAGMLV